MGTGVGVAVGGGVAVGRGVAVGGSDVGATEVGVGTGGTAVAVGSRARDGGGTTVGSAVWVSVTAAGLAPVGIAVGASCPPDWVQAAKAIKRAARMEDAAIGFKP